MKKYLILFIAILLGAPPLLYGQSDLVEIMTPNAMIIFDSSSSHAYARPGGCHS